MINLFFIDFSAAEKYGLFYIHWHCITVLLRVFLLLLFLLLHILLPLWHFSVGVTVVGGIDDSAAAFAVVVVIYVDN